jgi:5'/3'-nucleotidase SurE
VIVGCTGGGSNFGGLAFPFLREKLAGKMDPDIRCVEPTACPSLTKGVYAYDFGDTAGMTPLVKMHTLGHDFVPEPDPRRRPPLPRDGPADQPRLRDGLVEARRSARSSASTPAVQFARSEGIVPAPEPTHAIAAAAREAIKARETGEEKVILTALCGHGHFDLASYDAYLRGDLVDYDYPEEKVEREGIEVWTCSGYPADAVQLGIHALFDEPPAMVVAGVNLGYNHGAGFLMSSGTVGAAVEAWVSGIPAVAFSTGTTVDWPAWRRRVESSEAGPGWSRLSKVCAGLLDEVTGSGLLGHADVVSVNLPFDATPSTPRRVTSIARVGYDRLFRQEAVDRFRHEFGGGLLEFAGLEGTDVDAARRGWVSITPVRLPQAAEVPASITESLEADRG